MEQTQGKLVRICYGAVFDLSLNLRQSLSTFGKLVAVKLIAQNKEKYTISPGFAHRFLILSIPEKYLYKTTISSMLPLSNASLAII